MEPERKSNGSPNTRSRSNEQTPKSIASQRNKSGTVIYIRFARSYKGEFIRKTVVVQGSHSNRSDRLVNLNQVSHNGREGTRSPERNGASVRQSLIMSWYN
jgi:hypothetical protein